MYRNQHSAASPVRHVPWNRDRLIGPKPPLKLQEIWAIRIRLQLAQRIRDACEASSLIRATWE